MRGRSIATPELVNETIQRAEVGGFNAIFVNVFSDGQSWYDSALVEKTHRIDPAFDPLALLVPEAHRRGIKVHAWFVVGRIDDSGSPIFLAHPDWSLVGPDGDTTPWLNFTRPDVRQFVSDLVMEPIQKYGVDGVHFDYTRYPGAEWGFDPYSIQAFKESYGLDLNQMRFADLPAYGLFEGNPLINPSSAKVLASFNNGTPAVVRNQFGKGEVILLNWNASKRTVAIGSELLRHSLESMLAFGGEVYILRSETNAEEYDYNGFENTLDWLKYLGYEPIAVAESHLNRLEAGAVLILPNVYLISNETADDLADFVRQGGGVIFIDGPTKSMHIKEIREVIGMLTPGLYFKKHLLMTAVMEDPLLPVSKRTLGLEDYNRQDAQWKEFRRQGISTLLRQIFERVKRDHGDVAVSITITSDQAEARDRTLQDWRAWLENGYIDFLIPRGYVDSLDELDPIMNAWRPALVKYDPKITFGVISFVDQGELEKTKPSKQVLDEMKMLNRAGSNGFMVFDLGRMSNEQLSAIKDAYPGATVDR